MTQATTKETGTTGREAVRMYPNNSLGQQIRELSDTFSGFAMLREQFAKK